MKHYKHIIIAVFTFSILGTPWLINTFPKSIYYIDNVFSYANNLGAVFLREAVTIIGLKDKYNKKFILTDKGKLIQSNIRDIIRILDEVK